MPNSRVRRVLVAGGLTLAAFVALLLLFVPVLLAPVPPLGKTLLAYSVPEFGFAAVAILFLLVVGEDRTYIDVDWPNVEDNFLTVGATIALVAFNLIVHWAFVTTGLQSATQFAPATGTNPYLILALLSVVFVLVVGPTEELFFRGVIQRYLDGALSRRGAYAWTSVIFAAFHLPGVAGAGGGLPQYVLVGGILFVVSWTLGWLYDRTRNLLVPVLVHGLYDVLVYASLITGLMP